MIEPSIEPILKLIKSKNLLVVEGIDEANFFSALLSYIGIKDFDIRDVGGQHKFKKEMDTLVINPGFSKVEILALVRDAHDDAQSAFKSLLDSLKSIQSSINFDLPDNMNIFSKGNPKIGIFIMPNNKDPGMLEDLCLKTITKDPAMKCVDSFINCALKLDNPPKNEPKAKVQTFLAAMPEIVNCIGLGAQKSYWNFDSNELNDLKSFLNNLK